MRLDYSCVDVDLIAGGVGAENPMDPIYVNGCCADHVLMLERTHSSWIDVQTAAQDTAQNLESGFSALSSATKDLIQLKSLMKDITAKWSASDQATDSWF